MSTSRSFNDRLSEYGYKSARNILGGIQASGLEFLKAGPKDTGFKSREEIRKHDPYTGLVNSPDSLFYTSTNNTYSGTDCTIAVVYNENILILGNVATMSYSIHREKSPVRTLGRTYAKDFTRGYRTVAGSIIFTQFDETPLYRLFDFFNTKLENTHRFSSPLLDEIPPFDILLIFNNEYGYSSIIRIYGVEITDEGGTTSINDIYSEHVVQYVARDIDPMVSSGSQGHYQKLLFEKMAQGKVVDQHYASLIKYADSIMVEINQLTKELDKMGKDIQRHTNLKNLPASQWPSEPVAPKKEKYTKYNERLNRKRKEYYDAVEVVRKYETTRRTWDMNSAIQPSYTTDPVIKA
jgi:hypothetical protein